MVIKQYYYSLETLRYTLLWAHMILNTLYLSRVLRRIFITRLSV